MCNKANRICAVCGSSNRVTFSSQYGDFLCNIHRMQLYHSGKIRLQPRNGPSKISISGDCGKIELLDKDGCAVAEALIDANDIERCSRFRWHLQSNGYVSTTINGKRCLLHRFILEAPNNMLVDHINHDTLNNRKGNLRLADCSQNNMNRKLERINSTGFSGVYRDKRDGGYDAYITAYGERKYLGHFQTLKGAVYARNIAEQSIFGEFQYNGG